MYHLLQADCDQMEDLLTLIKEKSVAYLDNLHQEVTDVSPLSHPPDHLPEEGRGLKKALEHFYAVHRDKLAASAGPRYWGFVTGGATPAAIAGDWLTAVFDQNTQSVGGPGGRSALVETETIRFLLDLFGLPHHFHGGFVTGATMSNFTCLAVGRQWAGLQKGNDVAREGLKTDVTVLSATPHSSTVKCLSLLGLGSSNIVTVKTAAGNREAMDEEDLEKNLQTYRDRPVILISSGGTVNTVDFDNLRHMTDMQKRYSFYWHVDAAFGGFASLSADHQHLLQGWEQADSIAVDLHKWMNVPYDSAIYLVNKKHTVLQTQTFQNSNAPYLDRRDDDFTYLNFGPENSRRFRALPAWLSLMAYGKNGFRAIVENSIRLASLLGRRLEEETIFRLAAPVRLNVICFTTKDEEGRKETLEQTRQLLNRNGKVFMTPTVYKSTPCLRAALVNWRTTEKDIDIAIKELQLVQKL